MTKQLVNSYVKLPTRFIVVCALAFIAGVWATVYYHDTMCGDMKMPGDWRMSMMWMRMPDQSWFQSGLSFQLMWLGMMAAMMMPSALPTFLKTRQPWTSLCLMAIGYFMLWAISGIVIYLIGVLFAIAVMRSELFSRAMPVLLGAWLIAAGLIQFTKWKMTQVFRCRSSFGCSISCPQSENSFRLGCRQGMACCVCCIAPMSIQLAVGIMNPFVMIVVAGFITAEKLLPRPEITARVVGIAAISAGMITMARGDLF